MPRPDTHFVGVDVFILDADSRALLIRRTDDGLWATPGGYQDFGETPRECGAREVAEETGLTVKITRLMGVFSSLNYESACGPYADREITHILLGGEVTGGEATPSDESSEVEWFAQGDLPGLSAGHAQRIEFAFRAHGEANWAPHIE